MLSICHLYGSAMLCVTIAVDKATKIIVAGQLYYAQAHSIQYTPNADIVRLLWLQCYSLSSIAMLMIFIMRVMDMNAASPWRLYYAVVHDSFDYLAAVDVVTAATL